jgi:hypothetical protein
VPKLELVVSFFILFCLLSSVARAQMRKATRLDSGGGDYPEGVVISTEAVDDGWQVTVTAEAHVQGAGGRIAVRPAGLDLHVSVAVARQLWLESASEHLNDIYLMDAAIHWAPGGRTGTLLLGGGAWFVLSKEHRALFDTLATPHLEIGAQLVVDPGLAVMGTAGVLISPNVEPTAIPWFQLGVGWAF